MGYGPLVRLKKNTTNSRFFCYQNYRSLSMSYAVTHFEHYRGSVKLPGNLVKNVKLLVYWEYIVYLYTVAMKSQ